MITQAALALLLSQVTFSGDRILQDPEKPTGRVFPYRGIDNGSFDRILVQTYDERIDPPKISPKHKWEFEWVTGGLGKQADAESFGLRFQVFSQLRKAENDPALGVARMLMRLWDYNVRYLKFQHAPIFDEGRIHVYLCFGGKPGGEQLFDEDSQYVTGKKVNTIYIYAMQTFSDPLEMAREVAHEYGHATLPPVGGFKNPEDWGNGQLGEKLYLRWLRDSIRAGSLRAADAMGASIKALDDFVAKEVDPLMDGPALKGPDFDFLGGEGQKSMDAYTGLLLYMERLLSRDAFSRALVSAENLEARSVPGGIIAGCSVLERIDLGIPERYKGKDVWIPLGKGKVSNAAVLKKNGDWALIRPGAGVIRITNPQS